MFLLSKHPAYCLSGSLRQFQHVYCGRVVVVWGGVRVCIDVRAIAIAHRRRRGEAVGKPWAVVRNNMRHLLWLQDRNDRLAMGNLATVRRPLPPWRGPVNDSTPPAPHPHTQRLPTHTRYTHLTLLHTRVGSHLGWAGESLDAVFKAFARYEFRALDGHHTCEVATLNGMVWIRGDDRWKGTDES